MIRVRGKVLSSLLFVVTFLVFLFLGLQFDLSDSRFGAQLAQVGGSGVLTGGVADIASPVDLTSEGTGDWAHWGEGTATAFSHKASGGSQISNYVKIGSGTVNQYANNPIRYTWNDGTPTNTSSGVGGGIWIAAAGRGFQITVPASTAARTLKLYVGVYRATGQLQATLSDGSAATYTGTIDDASGSKNQVFTINYQAASDNQTLTLRYTVATAHAGNGNVTLHAASLTAGTPGGGGPGPCVENWACTDVGACVNGVQNQTCNDSNQCGTTVNQPGSTRPCTVLPTPVCGNGVIESSEVCDDGDASSGDGCSATCQVESGYTCTGTPSGCVPIVQSSATINPNLSINRASGTTPLAVFFDASGTTHSNSAVKPFHDLDYQWDFGDPGASFANKPGVNANRHLGPVAAHVFDLPVGVSSRTYTVTLIISDPSGAAPTVSRQQSITVSAFSGTTYYFSTAGSDSNNGLSANSPKQTWTHAMTLARNNTRLLFKRGDIFNSTMVTNLSSAVTGPLRIDAYGSGVLPLVNAAANTVLLNTSSTNDVVVANLKLVGTNGTGGRSSAKGITGMGSNFLLWRSAVSSFNYNVNEGNTTFRRRGVFLIDNIFSDSQNYNIFMHTGAVPVAENHYQVAIMANDLGKTAAAANIRVYIDYSVIAYNNFDMENYGILLRHGNDSPFYTKYVQINDNLFSGNPISPFGFLSLSPGSCLQGTVCSYNGTLIRDILIERNRFTNYQPNVQTQAVDVDISFSGTGNVRNITIRNNVIKNILRAIVVNNQTQPTAVLDSIRIHNNLWIIDAPVSKSAYFWRGMATNLYLGNNVVYAPEADGSPSYFIEQAPGPSLSEVTEEYNLVYMPSSPGRTLMNVNGVTYSNPYNTGSTWRNAGKGVGSVVATPTFVNGAGSNFMPLVNSPQVNAGKFIASDGRDYFGMQRPAFTLGTWDMGPYEYSVGSTCIENWTCQSWSACTNGNQTRTCSDQNNCGTTISKPVESQTCSITPTPVCGNGVIESPEVCDDGDASSGDGCSATCQVESGYTCTGTPSGCTLSLNDITPPSVTLASPASGSTVSGLVPLAATASDNVGVVGVQFKVDGNNLNQEVSNAPYGTTWDSRSASNGSHTLTTTARDAAGNTTTSASVAVTVNNQIVLSDTTPPTFSAIQAVGITANSAIISWVTNESATTQVNYGFSSNPYSQSTPLNSALVTSHTIALTGLSAGTQYHYQVVSADAAGNQASSVNQSFTTLGSSTSDTNPPEVITNLAFQASTIGANSVDLSWLAPREDAGVANAGPASSYDLRFSTGVINTNNWSNATQATGEPAPQAPGSNEVYTLAFLTPTTNYQAAVRSLDDNGNLSPLSNVISFTTTAVIIPPGGGGGGGPGGGGDTTPPGSVTQATAVTADKQVFLTWRNPTAPDFVRNLILRSDKAFRSSGNQSPHSLPHTKIVYEGDLEQFSDTGLVNGQTYYYAIYAYDAVPNYSAPVLLNATPQVGSLTQSVVQNVSSPTINNSNSCVPSTTTATPLPTVVGPFAVGSTGTQVRVLQQMLALDAFYSGAPSGNYDQKTITAVQAFQRRQNLVTGGTPDTTGYGLAGPNTRVVLNRLYAGRLMTTSNTINNCLPTGTTLGSQSLPTDRAALLDYLRLKIIELQKLIIVLIQRLISGLTLQLNP